MRQFDVFENPSPASRDRAPLVVVLQSHFLTALPTVVVAPLRPGDSSVRYTEVSVPVEVSGTAYIASISEVAVVDVRVLRRKVGDLTDVEDALRRALERLFTGF